MAELQLLPHLRTTHIVIGTSIRKPINVVRAYLKSLAWQVLPPNTTVEYCFVLDTDDDMVVKTVKDFVKQRKGLTLSVDKVVKSDYADQGGDTHHWQLSSMARVAANKNRIIQYARDRRADYLWFVDADLIMEPTTLTSLLSLKAPIACAVYWTRWWKGGGSHAVHAAPQVWLTHPYGLSGRGYEEWEFRKRLVERRVTQVWGQGACSLLDRKALESGIDFTILDGLPEGGMWQGEDRSFCIKAERQHLPMFADPWPDIFHVYHDEDHALIDQWLDQLGRRYPGPARIQDMVSLKLEALETPVQSGGQIRGLTQFVRGRLAALQLLPELEVAVGNMEAGTTRTIPCHFPASWPVAELRGQRRLIRVTVVDVKPFRHAPVVGDEILLSRLDITELTRRQIAAVAPQEAVAP